MVCYIDVLRGSHRKGASDERQESLSFGRRADARRWRDLDRGHTWSGAGRTIDAYSGTDGGTLFDLALITAEQEQRLATEWEVRLVLQINPAGLACKLLFGFTASVLLP